MPDPPSTSTTASSTLSPSTPPFDSPPDSPSPITPHTHALPDTEFHLSDDDKPQPQRSPRTVTQEQEVERGRPRERSTSSHHHDRARPHNRPTAGMGITFPGETNPFPAELSTPHLASSHTHTLLDTALPDALGVPKHRTRTVSPRVPTIVLDTGAFSTARVPSGTDRKSPVNEGWVEGTPPSIDTPLFESPPADGKKEPSVHPSMIYNKAISWAQQYTPASGYSTPAVYPYSGNLSVKYLAPSVPTRPEPTPKFTDSAAFWLILYFFFNLGLTLFNKIVLVSFPFPYTLTGLHALSACAGCYIALERDAFTPARLGFRDNIILALFSVLYTVNIAVSNLSLHLVTVPFHQVVRAATPLFTLLIATIILRQKFSMMKLVSLLPVVAGVGFATYGDYYFTTWGLILTVLGTFLAALKTIVTNVMQTGTGGRLKLHPLDLLMRMSPLAFIQCVIYGYLTGELDRVREYGATQMTQTKAIALLCNGIIACGLNIVSFTANKKAGALTMTVSANCKQVLTIALAVFLFNLHITLTNGIGILLTLLGGGWYAYVEYVEKNRKRLSSVISKALSA